MANAVEMDPQLMAAAGVREGLHQGCGHVALDDFKISAGKFAAFPIDAHASRAELPYRRFDAVLVISDDAEGQKEVTLGIPRGLRIGG